MRGGALMAMVAMTASGGVSAGPAMLPGPPPAMDMVEGDTLLLVGTMDGGVHAVSGASGALLWSFDSEGKVVGSSFLARLEARSAADATSTGHDDRDSTLGVDNDTGTTWRGAQADHRHQQQQQQHQQQQQQQESSPPSQGGSMA